MIMSAFQQGLLTKRHCLILPEIKNDTVCIVQHHQRVHKILALEFQYEEGIPDISPPTIHLAGRNFGSSKIRNFIPMLPDSWYVNTGRCSAFFASDTGPDCVVCCLVNIYCINSQVRKLGELIRVTFYFYPVTLQCLRD